MKKVMTFHTLFLLQILSISAWSGVPTHIDTAFSTEIGGIRQWISIKGTNVNNPVLLFLHGGPGNSVMGYAEKFTSDLQKKFVVVQWDQRESGKTAELNHSDKSLTVPLMESDAIELIHYLQNRMRQKKIYLMGHSWGGFLGLLIAAHHPDLLHAYVAVSPMIDQLESERQSLRWLMEKAKAEDNKAAISALSTIKIPFENGDQLFIHRYWLLHYMGSKKLEKEVVLKWADTWLGLFNEASAINFFKVAPSLNCPVYFFVGAKDIQTSNTITSEYYNTVRAENKKLYLFENTAHNLPTAQPVRLQETIIKDILIE